MHFDWGQKSKLRVSYEVSDLDLALARPRNCVPQLMDKSWVEGCYYEGGTKKDFENSWMLKRKPYGVKDVTCSNN